MPSGYDLAHQGAIEMADNGYIPVFDVVINHEEQYSIWRADTDPPKGWRKVNKRGSKEECLMFIKNIWTDMRPRSLREQMEK
jgi:MbtH protein